MTPLEELQAAHKRLSGLREDGPAWTARHEEAEVMSGPYYVASTAADQYTDLIVTLHRTIDAQLAVIDAAVTRMHVYGKTSPRPEVLALARAINEAASE